MMNVCKYYFDNIEVIFGDGTKGIIPKMNIVSSMIERNYDNNFFPIFYIKCAVSRSVKQKILHESKTVKFNVKLYKSVYKNNVKYIDGFNNKQLVIKDIFSMASGGVSVSMTNELQSKVKNIDNDPSNQNDELELYLFKQGDLNRYRSIQNLILKNVTIADVIVYLSNLYGINKLLLSKPNNSGIIGNFILPPSNYLGAIDYIQKMYGIYSHGYTIFNDFNMVYLLDKINKCTASKHGEFKKVLINIPESEDLANFDIGFDFNRKELLYKINTPKQPTVEDSTKEYKDYMYNKLLFNDTSACTVQEHKLDIPGDDRTHIMDMRNTNVYNIQSNIYKIEEKSKMVTISLPEIDMDIISVNKEYYINFDMSSYGIKDYNKNYRLTRDVFIFDKSGNGINECFTCKCITQFKVK